MLKDFKSKIAINNVLSPKNKQTSNFSLNKRKKLNSETKILKQTSSTSEAKKLFEKQLTFSPVNNSNQAKVSYTTKNNNVILKNPQYSAKIFEQKNESMSKDKELIKKNSVQYNTSKYPASVVMTEANSKNIKRSDSNNMNTNYSNVLTENCLTTKNKNSKSKSIYNENKMQNDVNYNFSPKNVHTTKNVENCKKTIFDYKLKTSIKLSKNKGGGSESPMKKIMKEVSAEQGCFKIEKFDEIKMKILNFCKINNLSINEVKFFFGKIKFLD